MSANERPLRPSFEQFARTEREAIRYLIGGLEGVGLATDQRIAAEGFRFDIAVRGAAGRQLLIDVIPTIDARTYRQRRNDFRARAHLVTSTTAAQVFFVLAPIGDIARFAVDLPFVWLDETIPLVVASLQVSGRAKPSQIVPNAPEIFVAMPFSTRYSDVYKVAILGAAKAVKIAAFRVDYQGAWGDIVKDIKFRIDRSIFVVGDLSESRPNVLYEVGYAHASGRTTVLIRSDHATARSAFDVAHERIHSYEINDTHGLERFLRRAFREELRSRGLLPPDGRRRAAR